MHTQERSKQLAAEFARVAEEKLMEMVNFAFKWVNFGINFKKGWVLH